MKSRQIFLDQLIALNHLGGIPKDYVFTNKPLFEVIQQLFNGENQQAFVKIYPLRSNFPAVGDTRFLYVAEDTQTIYYWSSSDYLTLSSEAGLSAYEVALINGFIGTEEQWLESLIGPPGPRGEQGPPGETAPSGLIWRGNWITNGNIYEINDAVSYNGSSWWCYTEHISGADKAPFEGSLYWAKLSSVGATGPEGPVGDTGSPGPIGPTGSIGLTGPQGPIGSPGIQGTQGVQGETGSQGPAGVQGNQGLQGSPGPTGSTGEAGSPGPTGPKGDAGPIGPAGLTWRGLWTSTASPSYVINNAVGYDGASYFCYDVPVSGTDPTIDTAHWALLANIGATGPQGPQGSPGEQGPRGIEGSPGPQGVIGVQGPRGFDGSPGPAGSTGADGSPGPQGSQGLPGPLYNTVLVSVVYPSGPSPSVPPGGTATVLVADATRLLEGTIVAIGESGYFTILNISTSFVTIENSFSTSTLPLVSGSAIITVSPRGPQGVNGVAGVQGSPGEDGNSITVKGTVVNPAALSGIPSPAIGDLWVSLTNYHGWVWNGSTWVDVGPIQGPQGIQGSPGTNGLNGSPGATGSPGLNGVGVTSIVWTSSTGGGTPGIAGATDTYTINYTDTSTFTFNVYNGADGEGVDYYVDGSTGANTYSITTGNSLTSNTNGDSYLIKFKNANTGTSTLNVDGIGPVTLKNSKTQSDLLSGDIPDESIHLVVFANSFFEVVTIGASSAEPTGTAGGDLSGTYPNPIVDGLQGRPVLDTSPSSGQILQWNGSAWIPGAIPTGGTGGGGVVYYLNFNTAGEVPLTNIPTTPNTPKELGLVGEVTPTSYQSAHLSTGSYDFLASFVTDVNLPSSTTIPAGIWDFNIFVESTSTNSANQVYFQVKIYQYDDTETLTLLGTSSDVYIYDPAEINQYVASIIVPQKTILATDRIVVYLYGRSHQNSKHITFHFGGSYPSHVHTTLPSVTGTGFVKVIDGVYQSPASDLIPVANGGTGLTTLTPNNIILGNGTGSPSFVAPGNTGNLLTSDGTTWTSAPFTGGVTDGDKGDITVSTTTTPGDTWTIDNNAITTAKIANAQVTVAKIFATGTQTSTTFLSGTGAWSAGVNTGVIASGAARRLALYTAAGTGIGDVLDTGNTRIVIAAHATGREYTIDNVNAPASFVMTAGAQTIAGLKTFSTFTSYGLAQTLAAPTINTRSNGSRILVHEALSATQADYAIGVESGGLWSSVPAATSSFYHAWYGGNIAIMGLRGDGILTIASRVAANYITASIANTILTTHPLQVKTVYGTTNYTYSNIVLTTVTANYTSITANASGVTISGTGMSLFTRGAEITLSNVTGVTGLSTSTPYYVIASTATAITIAASYPDALATIPVVIKTASGSTGTITGAATNTYVEVTGIGTGSSGTFSALTDTTAIALSNITGITAGLTAGTVYYSLLSTGSSFRLSSTILNSLAGTEVNTLTGTYNALNYTAISTGAEVVVTGASLPALTAGTAVYLSNTTGITNLNTTTIYYVYASVVGSLKLSATASTTPITNATGAFSGSANLRGVLSVGWGPTRGTGIQLYSGSNNPNGAFTERNLATIEAQYSTIPLNGNLHGELIIKTLSGTTGNLSEKLRIHSSADAKGITVNGTIGSSTGNTTIREPLFIQNSTNPATVPQLSITGNSNYSWMRFDSGGNEWPKALTGLNAGRSTGERINFGDTSNLYPSSIGMGLGTSPANGQTFWWTTTFGVNPMTFTAEGGFNFFNYDNPSATENIGWGAGTNTPIMSISRVGFGSTTALILRSKRQYGTALNKTISEINRNNTTNTLFVRTNNVTSLSANQVGRINITPTSNLYNGIVGRMLTVSGTATYGNLTFTANSVTSTGTETTLLGGAGNVLALPAFITGTAVSFSSVGTLSGLTAGTTYYVYEYSSTANNNFGSCKLASSYANAINNVAITGTGTVINSVCSVAPIAANSTEGVIVYGIPSFAFIPPALSTIVTNQIGLTSSTSFITAGTPVALSNVGSLTGVTAGTVYYLYAAVTNGFYSWFRLANTFANAIATTPLSGASGEMTIASTGTATSNSVTIYSTISDTYTSGGTLDAVMASGSGGNAVGIYFDKDDDLGVNGTTGFPKNLSALSFTRTGPPGEGVFGLFYDNNITQKVSIASNSTNINIAENIYGQDNATINILASGQIDSTVLNSTRTINIGTGYANSSTRYSTTNINIGNAQSPSSRMLTISNLNLTGRVNINTGNYIFYTTPTIAWSTIGGSFNVLGINITDRYTTAGSTVVTRAISGFQASTISSANAINVTNAVNVYVAAGPTNGGNTTIANTWGLYAEGNTRLNVLRVDSNVGFYGTTPVTRASAYTQTAYSTADKTHAASTYVSPGAYVGGANGYSTTTQAQAIITALGQLNTDLLDVKQLVNAIIDDLQAYGLFQ